MVQLGPWPNLDRLVFSKGFVDGMEFSVFSTTLYIKFDYETIPRFSLFFRYIYKLCVWYYDKGSLEPLWFGMSVAARASARVVTSPFY